MLAFSITKMALHKEWLIPFATVIRKHQVKGPAFGLGDQQTLFTASYGLAQLKRAGLIANPAAPVVADHIHPECVSFRSILGLLGIDDYRDIDMNGEAALNIDLGKPLSPEYHETAGCVFDLGTLEHVFDIGEGFRNVCRLLKPGGVVIHFSPISAYNHGLWNLTPQLFAGFYEVNDFEILEQEVIFSPLYTLWSSLLGSLVSLDSERKSNRSRYLMRIDSRSQTLQHFCNFIFHPPRMYQFFVARKRSSQAEVKTFYQV